MIIQDYINQNLCPICNSKIDSAFLSEPIRYIKHLCCNGDRRSHFKIITNDNELVLIRFKFDGYIVEDFILRKLININYKYIPYFDIQYLTIDQLINKSKMLITFQ
jgi:hypothetical protein